MNLLNNKIKQLEDARGFTIVELLIVIVVIGILAAIVIVAYTGITSTANNSADKANATSLQKVAETVNAQNGSYPYGTDTATLTTAMNSAAATSIPAGVTISYIASTGTAPSYSTTLSNAANKVFFVKVCSASSPNSTGLNIYYPDRGSTSAAQVLKVGAGC